MGGHDAGARPLRGQRLSLGEFWYNPATRCPGFAIACYDLL